MSSLERDPNLERFNRKREELRRQLEKLDADEQVYRYKVFSGQTSDWLNVASTMGSAISRVAVELGGNEALKNVRKLMTGESVWPNPESLKYLEDKFPGSVETVFDTMDTIQRERHEEDLAKFNKPSLIKRIFTKK